MSVITTETELNNAIAAFDAETVAGTGTIDETTDLFAINNTHSGIHLVIDGNGGTPDGEDQHRGLFVYGGNVTINDLTIANAAAIGGNGGNGGGRRQHSSGRRPSPGHLPASRACRA
jgi:hypothetical protein